MSTGKAEQALKNAGVRSTRIRIQILAILYEKGYPLSHAEISTQDGLEEIDRVTIYRNLNLMLEKGLVHAVLGMDGAWRYCAQPEEAGRCPGGHAHFLCMECGRMFCLTDQPMPFVEVPSDFQVAAKQLVIYGKCDACLNKGKEN